MFASEPGCGAKAPPFPRKRDAGVVAIVTAIPEEFEAIARRIDTGERRRMGKGDGRFLLRGRMAGAPILLAMTGDGEVRAERGLSFLLRESPVSFLVGAGAAGALVPSLRAGQVIAAVRLVDETGEAPAPDPALVAQAISLGAVPATIVTVRRLLTSSKEKAAVAVRVGASADAPAVVDMESAAWARTAAGRSVPYVILRAVSDAFEDDLPEFLSFCLDAEGSVDRAAVARKLILHPAALPVLLRARERVREGAERVGLFLERLLGEKI
jgi:adenosylhomocysteine nucleosidase